MFCELADGLGGLAGAGFSFGSKVEKGCGNGTDIVSWKGERGN